MHTTSKQKDLHKTCFFVLLRSTAFLREQNRALTEGKKKRDPKASFYKTF